jgi:uncharacterized membrane protein YdjX (TVP38/TMEM64 family)
MTQLSKLKIILRIIYLFIVALVTFLFFYYEVYNYVNSDFIKNDRKIILSYINRNIFLSSFLFFLFSAIWFFLLGFGFPLVIVAGFIFGSVLGSLLLLMGFVVGSTTLYVFANYYFRDLVFKYFSNKYKSLNTHFKNNEIAYLLFFRLQPGIPSQAGSLIPILFNIKVKRIFFSYFFKSFVSLYNIYFKARSLSTNNTFFLSLSSSKTYLFNPHLFTSLYSYSLSFLIYKAFYCF